MHRSLLERRQVLKAGGAFLATAALGGCVAETKEEVSEPEIIVYPPPPETPRFFHERTIFGSLDVVEESDTSRFRRLVTGESQRGISFSKPFDCAVHRGRLYVSDTVSRAVFAFDFANRRFFDIGESGPGRLRKPLGLSIDASGRLYVCDGTTRRIQVFGADGKYLTSMGRDGDLERPSAVAVNAEGTRIYAVDTGGVKTSLHRVRVFDSQGNVIQDIGTRGSGPGQFNLPLNAAVHPDGRLFVVDTGNFRVQIFGPEGDFQHTFGKSGRYPGQFSHPKGIAIDVDGKLFITDTAFGLVQIFDERGQVLMALGDRSEAGGTAALILPAGVATDVDGRVYVVDQFFRKVEVFREATVPKDWPAGKRKTVAMPPPGVS